MAWGVLWAWAAWAAVLLLAVAMIAHAIRGVGEDLREALEAHAEKTRPGGAPPVVGRPRSETHVPGAHRNY